MAQLITAHVQVRPEATAVQDEHGASLTWQALDTRVNRWIDLLRGYDLEPHSRVAVLAGNRTPALEILLACLHSGLIVVPINVQLTPPEVGHVLRDCGCQVVLADEQRAATAREAVGLASIRPRLAAVFGHRPLAGLEAVEPLLEVARADEPASQSSGAVMLYTGGSTGHPKGVVNRLFIPSAPIGHIEAMLARMRRALDIPTEGTALLVGPWYHAAPFMFSLLPWLSGCRLLVHQRFDAARTLHTIDAEQVATTHLVPTHLVRLLRLPPEIRSNFRGTSLHRVWHGGGPCPVEVKRQMIDWWGPVLWEYYGATEGGLAAVIDPQSWLQRPGSVGRAVPPDGFLVISPDRTPVPAGGEGTIYLRRDPERDFEYHNAPEQTAAAHLGPGVFTYGDTGHLDEDGYLYLTGRVGDSIISGGVNIYPSEVEGILQEHPAVRDAVVFGITDDEYGQQAVAFVELDPAVPQDGRTTEILDQFCRRRLAGYKVPRAYRFVRAIPRESTGKTRRHLLREQWLSGTASPSRRA
ncbi:AMP-binding protein [Rugosimonospora acidiphila]